MIYAYYRCSTESQMDRNGFQMQIDTIKTYCEKNQIEIAGYFEDRGISGTKFDREGLVDMLATLKDGDKIIVQNTSRLWRDDVTKVMIQKELRRTHSDVMSVENPAYSIYSKDPSEFLINGILEILDQYDRMSIVMKLAKGRIAKAKNGEKPCGRCPIGYKWDGADVVIDYNNNLIVEDIFKCYIENKSLQKVVDYCSQRGYKTSSGKDFSRQGIKNIINNRFYIGEFEYSGVQSLGKHEIFLDIDLFEKANEILSRDH